METLDKFTTQSFAASFTPAIDVANTINVSLTGNITSFNAPSGRSFGKFTVVFVQDATGGRTVTWDGTAYPDFNQFSGLPWQPSLAPSSISSISFYYDSNSSAWRPYDSFNGDVFGFVSYGGGTANSSNKIRVGANNSIAVDSNGFLSMGATSASTCTVSTAVQGGVSSGSNLTLRSTSNATKGKVYLGSSSGSAYDETNKRLGIGNVSPSVALDVTGAGTFSSTVTAADPTASTHLATKNYVDQRQLAGMATSTTSVGTSITALSGLSISSVPAGNWTMYAYMPVVVAGSTATTLTVTLCPTGSGAPTTSSMFFNYNRTSLTTTLASSAQNTVIPGTQAFNQSPTIGSSLAVGTYLYELQGAFVSTGSGTISLSMTRTGGTTITLQAGAYLRLERSA